MLIKKRQTAFSRYGKDSASYSLFRNKVQCEIMSAKCDHYHHKVSDLEQTDPKNGENCPDTKALANMLNDHFISLTTDFVPPGLLVSVREVQDSLSSLNVGKAIGPDMIPKRVLKEFAPEFAPLIIIMDIYNCSLREGYNTI
ncbi:hypothetical protein P5673_022447 [Acropora cervicornis]|uniref:Uncharacterized protein n=1 Tax=Acropora cervicornis TaxID=6130 RepID=A0AAD9Q6U1_ACRCE|nr:hypothetical protein P5673_022447 [Acropora cervicornis]